ncbi:MAG: signal peptidase I [Cyanobacteria bacterium P01_F01_bin.86]
MGSSFPPITANRPNPWLAVNYSLVFPGLGQLYSAYWLKGGVMVVAAIAMIGYATWSIFGAHGHTTRGFGTIGLFLVLYSFGILDAYRGTQPGYAARIAVPSGKSDPWYAVFLSQLLPGLGHLYLQQAAMGGGLLVAGLVTAWLANAAPQLVPIPPLIWAFGCCHVYVTFPHRASRQSKAIALLVLGLLIMRLAVGSMPGWIRQAVEQCIVPTESMLPTLQVGDRLFVRRDPAYTPEIGDIVVFTPPEAASANTQQDAADLLYVKRVIGLPGQEVAITNGQVYVDTRPLAESYLQAAPIYEWGPETVPANSYFVLGDNRNESFDSHVWGYVPAQNLLGAAYKIYWPPNRVQPLQP